MAHVVEICWITQDGFLERERDTPRVAWSQFTTMGWTQTYDGLRQGLEAGKRSVENGPGLPGIGIL